MSDDEDAGEGQGWTVYPGANNPMRAMAEALNRGDTALASFHLMASIHQTLGKVEWEVNAMNLRRISDYGGDYGPEAEPTYDQAKQAAEAGDYSKSIAYGLMRVSEALDNQTSRLDEIVHLLKRPQ